MAPPLAQHSTLIDASPPSGAHHHNNTYSNHLNNSTNSNNNVSTSSSNGMASNNDPLGANNSQQQDMGHSQRSSFFAQNGQHQYPHSGQYGPNTLTTQHATNPMSTSPFGMANSNIHHHGNNYPVQSSGKPYRPWGTELAY